MQTAGNRTHLSRFSKTQDVSALSLRKDAVVQRFSSDVLRQGSSTLSPSTSLKQCARKPKEKPQKRAATQWGFEETIIFYEALKENGKNFEQISISLERKKYSRDKDQVKNFYYNTYKIYKEKAGITDEEWDGAPHAVRELLIVLNALEWKRRTSNGSVQSHKFKSLVLTGSTVLKLPQKRSSITIKTPSCSAFHKYFPSLRQYARAPQALLVSLVPYSYTSKHYVNTKCEMNPVLSVNIPCSASLSQLLDFLEQKWQYCEGEEVVSCPTIRLHPPEDFKPSMVEVNIADETVPSLNSLRCKRRKEKDDCAEYLDFDEILKGGIDRANCETLNFLQLFFLFNESDKIILRYDVSYDIGDVNCFEKLNELFVECEDIFVELKLVDKRFKDMSDPDEAPPMRRQPNKRLAEVVCHQGNVVDKERNMFVKQLAMLRNVGRGNCKKRKTEMTSQSSIPSTSQAPPTDFSPMHTGYSVSREDFGCLTIQNVPNSVKGQPIELESCNTVPIFKDGAQPEFFEMQNYAVVEDNANNTLEQILNEPGRPESISPSKSLMDDAFNLFDSMMDVNSCDFVANFTQLANHLNESQSQFSDL